MPTYFVTGAARGIGLELVRQLSSDMVNIVIAAIRKPSSSLLNLHKAYPNIHLITCDVSSEDSIASLIENLPEKLKSALHIDYLINNAAIVSGPDTTALNLTASAIYENIQTNVLGPAYIVRTLVPFLSPNALIVNVTSGIGSLTLVSDGSIKARVAAYSISKAALNMLSAHQAHELHGKARVVCLDPGHVKTELGGKGAAVEDEDSVRGVISALQTHNEGNQAQDDRGKGQARFLNFLGEEVPW